jgi:hypothetical protein
MLRYTYTELSYLPAKLAYMEHLNLWRQHYTYLSAHNTSQSAWRNHNWNTQVDLLKHGFWNHGHFQLICIGSATSSPADNSRNNYTSDDHKAICNFAQ